jgi:hypothetical protein
MSEDYTAKDIRVLTDDELDEQFIFIATEQLARIYRHVPAEVISRMLVACELSGQSCSDVVQRYLVGDRSVRVTSEFMECYQEELRARRWASWEVGKRT